MKIPLFRIYWDKKDIEAVSKSIKQGMDWASGPNIEKFEREIAKHIGRKYVLVFNSGTSALHALLFAYGVGKGDEVIVPSFTFIATTNAPLFVGAKPIFADIEEETYGLDPKDVRKKINSRTRAIIPVHYGGAVCGKIKELWTLAKKHNLLLIEDAAESFGAKLDNQKAGTFGQAAMFSFCQTKVFTTGEGGCIVTDSPKIYRKLRMIRAHGRDEDKDYVGLGYNFRMPDCIAALGVSQIKKAQKLIKIRRNKARYLTALFSKLKLEDIIIPSFLPNIYHVYQEYPIKVRSGEKTRDSLKKYLAKRGIGTRISFRPVHLTYFYKNILGYSDKLPLTEKVSKEALSLPIYPVLSKKEMDYITKEIGKFYGSKKSFNK